MRPENALSVSVKELIDTIGLRKRCLCFHIPNELTSFIPTNYGNLKGGTPAFIKKLKDQGYTPGIADWQFIWRDLDGHLEVVFIELKIGSAKQSPRQVQFEAWCRSIGVQYYVVRSLDHMIDLFRVWGLMR